MRILGQVGILCGVCLAGNLVAWALPFPFPASVAAMVLLFLLLVSGALRPAQLGETGDFLQRNMAFLLVPAGVGMIEQYALAREHLLSLVAVCLISLVLTFGATALTVGAVMRLQEKIRGGSHE